MTKSCAVDRDGVSYSKEVNPRFKEERLLYQREEMKIGRVKGERRSMNNESRSDSNLVGKRN